MTALKSSLVFIASATFIIIVGGLVEAAPSYFQSSETAPRSCSECPKSNSLFYYKCCRNESKECCLYLQSWLMVCVIGFFALTLGCMAIRIIRCVFCCCR